jgi:hypothetical protein
MKSNLHNKILVAAILATFAPLGAVSAQAKPTEKEKAEQVQKAKKTKADREAKQDARQEARQDVRQESRERQIDSLRERQAARLSKAQQTQLITTQQARVNNYRTWQRAQRTAAQQAAAAIQAQNRTAQYAYIQDYNNRLWSQQQQYMSSPFNYYNDPFFYSSPSYRYQREGNWYTINDSGYNMLQQAINQGYGEGYRSGRADRMDGWRPDYRSSYAYQNASYGYSG